uniref:Carbonyl reductase 1 n=1 Tax=Amphiprion percula TaxID=161767 RepID=A0A3P8TP79_AMPPE
MGWTKLLALSTHFLHLSHGILDHSCFANCSRSPRFEGCLLATKTNFFSTRDMLTHFLPLIKAGGRVVNVSSFVSFRTLNNCSPALQQRFRSEDITEDELVRLMQRFVAETQKGKHKEDGCLTTLSMIQARSLSKERPNDGILLNACCPGWVRTDMAGDKAPKSPDEGAITPVYLALLPPGATEPHGKFVSD